MTTCANITYTASVSGESFPTWATFNASTREFEITMPETVASKTFVVLATSSLGTFSKELSIPVTGYTCSDNCVECSSSTVCTDCSEWSEL